MKIILPIAILLILAAAAGGFVYWKNQILSNSTQNLITQSSEEETTSSVSSPTDTGLNTEISLYTVKDPKSGLVVNLVLENPNDEANSFQKVKISKFGKDLSSFQTDSPSIIISTSTISISPDGDLVYIDAHEAGVGGYSYLVDSQTGKDIFRNNKFSWYYTIFWLGNKKFVLLGSHRQNEGPDTGVYLISGNDPAQSALVFKASNMQDQTYSFDNAVVSENGSILSFDELTSAGSVQHLFNLQTNSLIK